MTERELLRAVYRQARRDPVTVERLGVWPRYQVGPARVVWGRRRAIEAVEQFYLRREIDLLEQFADEQVRRAR